MRRAAGVAQTGGVSLSSASKALRVATCRAVLQRVVLAPAASAPAVAAGSTALMTLRALAFGFGCSGRANGHAAQNRQRHHRTQSHEAACKDQDVQKVRPNGPHSPLRRYARAGRQGLHTRARTHTTRHNTHARIDFAAGNEQVKRSDDRRDRPPLFAHDEPGLPTYPLKYHTRRLAVSTLSALPMRRQPGLLLQEQARARAAAKTDRMRAKRRLLS
jgi:hypothetical protein